MRIQNFQKLCFLMASLIAFSGCNQKSSLLGSALGTGGSSGAASSGSPTAPTPIPPAWNVPNVDLIETSGTFNLASTLPSGTAVGGTFAVDGSGSPLPNGISLSACGVISNTATQAMSVAGVVFSYDSATACN